MRYTNEDFERAAKQVSDALERLQIPPKALTDAAVAYVIKEWLLAILTGADPDTMISKFVDKHAGAIVLTITATTLPHVTPPPATPN